MKKYKVIIIERLMYTAEVEALDEQEADDKAGDLIEEGVLEDGERLDIETKVSEMK